MRTYIIFLIALFILNSGSIKSQWIPQTNINNLENSNYSSVKFVNANTGWAVGNAGRIIKSKNSGNSWEDQNSQVTEDLTSSFFINENTGWVCGASGIILKTIDGGSKWVFLESGLGDDLYSIYFVDANTGYSCGDFGKIIKTTDGGLNWSLKPSGTGQILSSLSFINNNTGWAGSSQNVCLYTSNAGENWQTVSSSLSGEFSSISFVNSSTGFWVGKSGTTGVIYKSTNSGTAWFTSNLSGLPYRTCTWISTSIAYAAGEGGKILKTTDGGTSWLNRSPAFINNLSSLNFINENTGWACGDGIILKTSNGGTSWIIEGKLNFYAVKFVNNLTGWVCGERGAIFKTTNNGGNWNLQITNINKNIVDFSFVNENTGWALADYGIVIHTSDGGSTWERLPDSSGGIPCSIYFANSMTGWSFYPYRKTTNGGVNWITTSFQYGLFFNPSKMLFINENVGFILGSELIGNPKGGHTVSKLYRTFNGGVNWGGGLILEDPVKITNNIFFLDENFGVIVGEYIWVTTNGGSAWSRYSLPLEAKDVYFKDEQTGWISCTSGCIYKTVDGGANWTIQNAYVAPVNLNSICMLDDLTGWVCGANNTLLKTTNGGTVFITPIGTSIPEKYHLSQNYPNPFNPNTTIRFDLPKKSSYEFSVYNILGMKVYSEAKENLFPGSYNLSLNMSTFASGIYFYTLRAGDFYERKQMVLVK